ncbi:MAG: GDSL-type esterase/lipase family protein [Gemmatimonadota bacterium]|nr:GDSL-type esterase/lipase family protein [Gemmatimonadota bacterium]
MLPYFTQYVALGDSMSIDLYPALDAGETDVAVALERDPTVGAVAPLGAASLFYQNDDARWPEEQGDDLVSRYVGIAAQNLATDNATIGDVFGEQLAQLQQSDDATLVTLTVGGNDLLSAFSNRPRASLLERIAKDVAEAYEFLVEAIQRARPNALIVMTTIYDPSDRSGRIPGVLEDAGVLPLSVLEGMNASIARIAEGVAGTAVADVYEHFIGHGATAEPEDRWYWRRSLVEPNAVGAHEIRRVWREALDLADADLSE